MERKVALVGIPGSPVGGGQLMSPGPLPPRAVFGKSFCSWKGAMCRNSTVRADSRGKIGHAGSDQRHLDAFQHNSSSAQGQVVPIPLRPVLGIVAACVMAAVWATC